MTSHQNITMYSDEGTIWFCSDNNIFTSDINNFFAKNKYITIMGNLLGIETINSYDCEIDINFLSTQEKNDLLNFYNIGQVTMPTDNSGILAVGWLEAFDEYFFMIPKTDYITLDFWINQQKTIINIYLIA